MSRKRVLMWFLVQAVLSSILASAAEGPRAVPDDGVLRITEYGYRDWAPDLVHYRVDTGRFKPGKRVLLDAQDRAVPFQIESGVLSFVAGVGKGEAASWRLVAALQDRSRENSTLAVRRSGDVLEAGNEFFTLSMPPPGQKAYPKPVPAGEVPLPMLRWKPANGAWMGAMRWAGAPAVSSWSADAVREGPACFEYVARYTFATGGRYVWSVRVVPGVPLARITEEMDSVELKRNNEQFLLLDASAGWQPQTIRYCVGGGESALDVLSPEEPLAGHIEKKSKEAFAVSNVGGMGQPPPPVKPEKGLVLLNRLVPAGRWGGLVGGLALAGAAAGADGKAVQVAVVPLSVGGWRRAMALNVWGTPGGGVAVGLPLDARWMWWQYDCTDERSPFSTHEHDEGLKPSYARRVWGLHFGPEPNLASFRYGLIGVDRYKDWIVDWPDARQAYPRAFFTPAIVEEVKKTLDQHPDRDILRELYVINGKPEAAAASAKRFLGWVKGRTQLWNYSGLSHYRQAESLKDAYLADDALACPDLSPELRAEVRRHLALWAYLESDPDFNPRGAGVHLGNNNMTINRTCALPLFAGLLPDHPLYAYWMDRSAKFLAFKLGSQTACDGTFIESLSYTLYGPARFLDSAINIHRNTGTLDVTDKGYTAALMRYLAHLSVPDVRFNGLRILPGMGNGGDMVESIWGLSMRAAGPAQAGFLRQMHTLAAGPNGVASMPAAAPYYAFNFQPAAPGANEALGTTILPTWGVVFRNHFGPRETTMLFRTGINWSHWDTDAFNVILYAKGAPLSPGTGYGYAPAPPTANNALYHNQAKPYAHDTKEIFGRVDAPVRDYGFGPSADYAMGDRYYPPELYPDKTERHWRRHVLFLKSARPDGPSYFVMRDTFPGNPKTDRSWWTWLNLGEADQIAVEGTALARERTPHDIVPDLAALPIVKGRTAVMKTAYGANTWFWLAGDAPLECRARLTFKADLYMPYNKKLPMLDFGEHWTPPTETKTIFEAMAPAGQDYHYVVYPREDGEAAPACTRLLDGVLKVVTPEATDYVFLADAPLDVKVEGVEFSGKAGAVRVFPDRVALCLNSGNGRIGYKGFVLEGHGPFERTVPLADLKPGIQKVEGGYAKQYATVDLGRGVTVMGEKPFEAKLDGEAIRIRIGGRARVLNITQPAFIRRPQYWIDGQEWMACWTDWPDSGFGAWTNTDRIALSVPDGGHELVVRDLVFPEGWSRAFAPLLGGVQHTASQ